MLFIDEDGNRTWFNKEGELHREDGPAIEWNDGVKFWYRNGKQHREDGYAVEWENGIKAWYLNGEEHTEEEYRKKVGGIC